MSKNDLHKWVEINTLMRDDFREEVLDLALNHLNNASGELKSFAKTRLRDNLTIPGFRNPLRAPHQLLRTHLLDEMQTNAAVSDAILCLWGDAQSALIERLCQELKQGGFGEVDYCLWNSAKLGFLVNPQTEEWMEFVEALCERDTSWPKDHLHLAIYWLSSSLQKNNDVMEEDAHSENAPIESFEIPEDENVELNRDQTVLIAIEPDEKQRGSEVMEATQDPASTTSLEAELEYLIENYKKDHATAIDQSGKALSAIKDLDLGNAKSRIEKCSEHLIGLIEQTEKLREMDVSCLSLMGEFAEERPDLELSDLTSLYAGAEALSASGLLELSDLIFQELKRINLYDREKDRTVAALDEAQGEWGKLLDQLNVWDTENSIPFDIHVISEVDAAELTLGEAKENLESLKGQIEIARNHLEQIMDAAWSRISVMVEKLKEMGMESSDVVIATLSLGDLESRIEHRDLNDFTVKGIETKLSELQIERSQTSLDSIASDLFKDWDPQRFTELLEQMAQEGRDAENVLLLLSAKSLYPSDESIGALSSELVESLLRGLDKISEGFYPFGALGIFADDFFRHLKVDDSIAKAKLALACLIAGTAPNHALPEAYYYALGSDWPLEGMSNWSSLWNSKTKHTPVHLTSTDQQKELDERLRESRSKTQSNFTKGAGTYSCIRSVQSKYHREMLTKRLLPDIETQFGEIKELEDQFAGGDDRKKQLTLRSLRLKLRELSSDLEKEAYVDHYESAAYEMKVTDADDFHRRVSLKILRDCLTEIYQYALELERRYEHELASDPHIYYEGLEEELKPYPDIMVLGHRALDMLRAKGKGGREAWSRMNASQIADMFISKEFLGQARYALNVPAFISHLARHRFELEKAMPLLLSELSRSRDTQESADYLLENDSPNQVLLFSDRLPVEAQKEAQRQKASYESRFNKLIMELMKVEPLIDDMQLERELGRWHIVIDELQERLNQLTSMRESDEEEFRTQLEDIRLRIRNLEDQMFETKNVPNDVYQVIQAGFYIAKTHLKEKEAHPSINNFLEEMEYRISRKSWVYADLEAARLELEKSMDVQPTEIDEIALDTLLDLFENDALGQIGLTHSDVSYSEVQTRWDALNAFIHLKKLDKSIGEYHRADQRNLIKKLFSSFTQMVRMKIVRDQQGKPISKDTPTPYSYRALIYPRTYALDDDCVLVTLPGDPPSPKSISELQSLIEDKDWLASAFVILFAPGATSKIVERLETSNHHRGLVVLDAQRFQAIILAEADQKKPLDRLRSMMLVSRGAENVDVFKINQLVESRTSIFIGREELVNRITSSGDNYAVYGGRRIGKSSVLKAVEDKLRSRNLSTCFYSLEGEGDCSDDAVAIRIANRMKLNGPIAGVSDFKLAVQDLMEQDPDRQIHLLIDEIDKYIAMNRERNLFVETLRALSELFPGRFRVVMSGFMEFRDCLKGRGPYTPTSDPWPRMLNDIGPLRNLHATSAEGIVKEGFLKILGWRFENRAIPQRIVERTGGHPAFVQKFCKDLQALVAKRGDRIIRVDDIGNVFKNEHPEESFVAYVRETLEMNLDPVAHYLILWIAKEDTSTHGFTKDQFLEFAEICPVEIPKTQIDRSLERLVVTSVVDEVTPGNYEFSVPDYPMILDRLGKTSYLERLENEICNAVENDDANIA